jgi:hypothetical protein
MKCLQTVPSLGLERTSTPEGLTQYLEEIDRVPRTIASRIVPLGTPSVTVTLIYERWPEGDYSWNLTNQSSDYLASGSVGARYWNTVYEAARDLANAISSDHDYPEKLATVFEGSSLDFLYRYGVIEQLNEAEKRVRSTFRYRNYRREFYGKPRFLKQMRAHVAEVRRLRKELAECPAPAASAVAEPIEL